MSISLQNIENRVSTLEKIKQDLSTRFDVLWSGNFFGKGDITLKADARNYDLLITCGAGDNEIDIWYCLSIPKDWSNYPGNVFLLGGDDGKYWRIRTSDYLKLIKAEENCTLLKVFGVKFPNCVLNL